MNNTTGLMTRRNILEHRYKSARISLLTAIIFTAVNLILLILQSNMYFLFSATIPYLIVDMGMYMTGMYPPEYYAEFGVIEFYDQSVFWFMLSVAVMIILLYVLCWLLSKKYRKGWLITALVFFVLDTVVLVGIYGITSDLIFDLMFHTWLIVDLSRGVHACAKLKKLPPEEATVYGATNGDDTSCENAVREDSVPVRDADMNVRARILLKTTALGKEVVYRRVKRVNELVINGKVYADIEMLAEPAHSLSARIDGHDIEVGFDGISASYAALDGQIIARKTRLI